MVSSSVGENKNKKPMPLWRQSTGKKRYQVLNIIYEEINKIVFLIKQFILGVLCNMKCVLYNYIFSYEEIIIKFCFYHVLYSLCFIKIKANFILFDIKIH